MAAATRVIIAVSCAVVVACGGLIAWRVLKHTSAPKPSAVEDVANAITPPPTPPKVPSWAASVSTIIDLPGDPVVVQRGAVTPPRELHISLPIKVAPNAPKAESAGYFIDARLISTDGGYMGKFPESGQDADALARQLEINAQVLASADDPNVGGAVMDDDGGGLTPENARDLMRTTANSNKLEVSASAAPQIKQTVIRALVAEKISDLLISNGYSEDSSRQVEAQAKAIFNHQTLLPRGIALAVGARDPSGAYRVTQFAIYDGQEYVGAIALAENGAYVEGARPEASRNLADDAGPAVDIGARFSLADGIYSAGLRNAMPEPVIREAIQMLAAKTDLKAPAPSDETVRILYARDFRDKAKGAGKVVYVGLSGSAGAADCYAFETALGAFRCFDPKASSSVPLPPTPGGGSSAPSTLGDSGAVSINGILAPIKGAPVTSLYGMRFHPILHILRLHGGIDFGAPVGSQVRASADGKVEIAGPVSGFGTHIRIQHKGFETSYSHLSEIPADIKPGVDVKQGQIIALSGNTGLSTGPHLHFEFYVDRAPVDPLPHLGAEVQATAPTGGSSIPLPPTGKESVAAGSVGASPAEIAAFPAIKAEVDAALELAAK